MNDTLRVILEIGTKRRVAGAMDWPGSAQHVMDHACEIDDREPGSAGAT